MNLKNEKGVISLEACIVVPIFIFLLLFVYGFIVMFMGQQMLSHSLLQSTESLSLDSYAIEKFHGGDQSGGIKSAQSVVIGVYEDLVSGRSIGDDDNFSSSVKWYEAANADEKETVIKNRFLGYLTGSGESTSEDLAIADSMLKMVGVKDGFSGIDFSECAVNDGVLTMKIKYKQEFVFDFNGLAAFDREMTATSKMWGL